MCINSLSMLLNDPYRSMSFIHRYINYLQTNKNGRILKTPLDEYKVRLYPASGLVCSHTFHV